MLFTYHFPLILGISWVSLGLGVGLGLNFLKGALLKAYIQSKSRGSNIVHSVLKYLILKKESHWNDMRVSN